MHAQVHYGELAPRVEEALREQFPRDTIDLEEGYMGRVHVRVVSRRFNGMSEKEKQTLVWRILRDKLGADAVDVALAIAYGTDELP